MSNSKKAAPMELIRSLQASPLKSGSRLIMQRDLDYRLTTNDIDGAQPRNLNILKGRKHQNFFNDYSELNEVYNKI
jgi:hypothetical protein